MALAPVAVATAIATLNMRGVRVLDLHDLPDEVFARDCPLLMPNPESFLTGFSVTRETFGSDSAAFKMAHYTFNYLLLYREVGEGRGLFDHYEGLVETWGVLLDALIANSVLNSSAVIDGFPASADIGIVNDPTGKQFFGFRLAVQILEYVNP